MTEPDRQVANVRFDAVFFDLDGTLVDTAPDMVAVLHALQRRHSSACVDHRIARNNVSNGALGLLRIAFPDADDATLQLLLAEYLEGYSGNVCVDSKVFHPLGELLSEFDARGTAWGVVTNKPERMTLPLMDALGLRASAACIVSGDSLPQRKPHPAPLLYAAEQAAVTPAQSLYVGDAARDIEAGNAAGMTTVAVGYGYITDNDDPLRWGADLYAADTISLSRLLRQAVGLNEND